MSTLSFSQIQTWLTCPKLYRYRYVDKLPISPSPYMSFGTSIHNALYRFLLQYQKSILGQFSLFEEVQSKEFFDATVLREIFGETWVDQGFNSREEALLKKQEGIALLERWHQEHFLTLHHTPWKLETGFRFPFRKWTIRGRFDRIDRDEQGALHIIDYKSGRQYTQSSSLYSLQMRLYAIAATRTFGKHVTSCTLHFLGDNTLEEVSLLPQDMAEAEEHLQNACVGITAAHDIATPKPTTCSHCDYRNICQESSHISL